MFKDREPFNIHEDFEFRIVRDTLHTRMIELEEINNGEYNGADPLTDEEMVKIFEHPDISKNWYSTFHLDRDKLSGMLKEICNITGIDCTNRRIVNHSLRKRTAQKLNDEGLDSQAIMNVILHQSIAGLNAYRTQNEKQKLDITKLTLSGISKDISMQENLEKSAEDLNTE
ncbi:hypothetical protein RhiirA1_446186 [Rhizophagus irregularis]|uniref:Tyr recombinase domain-containing protein n=1 Tax=Rhizophagus irregularis TaxID=588596 RepID=A0A2N0R2A4_9GLOM|nr:hypothetical protein RhiirA1_446186 [Rhizophagus irregularis]